MRAGVSTWDEIGDVGGNVLLIVNSEADRQDEVLAALERIRRLTPPSALHVICPIAWRTRLVQQGVAAGQLLVSADTGGAELELNHFLESHDAVHWALERHFRLVAGTAAHSLHNEEVKVTFEQSVGLLSQDAFFLTHALPAPFVYLFDFGEFVERFTRHSKQARYEQDARAIVADLHRLWIKRGRPGPDDSPESTGAFERLTNRIDPWLRSYDENAEPRLQTRRVSQGTKGLILHLRDVVHAQVEYAHRQGVEIDRLNAVVDERNAAVELRDSIIDDLKLKLEPIYRKILRLFK